MRLFEQKFFVIEKIEIKKFTTFTTPQTKFYRFL